MKLSKTQFASVVIICILSTTLLTTYFGFILGLDVGDVSTFYMDRGPRYSHSYIVGEWNSTHYYAMNGTTGQRTHLGTNETEIIQAAVDSAKGDVLLLEGTYTLTGAIQLPSMFTFSGVGRGTILTLEDNANEDILVKNNNPMKHADGVGNTNITIQNMFLDGNKNGQSGGQEYRGLVDLNNTLWATVQHCQIRYGNNHGIRVVERGVTRIMWNYIQLNNGSGIFMGTSSDDSYITNNDIGSNSLHGIQTSGGGHRHISDNNIQLNTYDGIAITGGGADLIDSNRILAQYRHGIHIYRAVRMVITDNIITQCDYDLDGTGSGIRLNGEYETGITNATTISGNLFFWCARGIQLYNGTHHTQITGNTIYNCTYYAIWERYTCNWTTISDNHCYDNGDGIEIIGASSFVTDCWNGTHFIENQWWNATGSNWEVETLPP